MKTLKTILFTIIAITSFLAMLFFLLCALGALIQSNMKLLVIFLLFVAAFYGVSYLSANIAKQGYPDSPSKSKAIEHEKLSISEASNQNTQQDSDKKKVDISIPKRKDGYPLAYHYPRVEIDELNYDEAMKAATEKSWQLTALLLNEKVVLQHNGITIGSIAESRRADMLRDWIKNEEPYLVYLENINTESKCATAFIAFYRDKRTRLNDREQSVFRLTSFSGQDKQLYISLLQAGDELDLDDDITSSGNPYVAVYYQGEEIGKLPKKYADRFLNEGAAGCFFDHDEYDDERDKYIPYVTIYW